MPRPNKEKRICKMPEYRTFVPEGAKKPLHRLQMTLEEYEAIRLIDCLSYTQEQCAAQMQVGRATVQAVYSEARKKLGRFLAEGAALEITGGCYRVCGEEVCAQEVMHCQRTGKEGINQMKIAVTYENGEVFQHFGHTEQFKIYEVEDGRILSSKIVDTDGSGHGALAGFLKEQGARLLICGGIGGGARNALAEMGIQLYPGACGDADAQVEAFLKGSLNYDPDTMCSHHAHEHEGGSCGNHGCGEHHCGS